MPLMDGNDPIPDATDDFVDMKAEHDQRPHSVDHPTETEFEDICPGDRIIVVEKDTYLHRELLCAGADDNYVYCVMFKPTGSLRINRKCIREIIPNVNSRAYREKLREEQGK